MRQPGAWYRGKRYASALLAGALLVGLSASPALALGAPDPPTITSVTRGNASITVAFTPGANNGSPILLFTASCISSNGGTSGTNTGTASPITVSLLTNGKTYKCTVTATNALGTSGPSAESAAVIPAAAPSPPTITSVTGGNASVSVAFTAGAANGSAITSFSASCTSSNGGTSGSNTGAASPITVTGLTNGKTYTCTVTATNAVGTSNPSVASLPVIPLGAPDAPTITSVTRGNASISVAFTAGADNGSTILLFTASCTSSNGGAAGSNTGTTSPISVGSLTNGKTYTCTVTATNAIGTSPASSASAPVVPATVPSAPAQPSVARGNHQIVVTFSPPADNGSAILSYTASCTSLDGGAPGSDSDTASPITVTGLTNGKTYTCTVTATNAIGTSSASPPSLPVIPAAVPDPPTITSVTSGNASISVAFTAGADNGSTILLFTASCTSSNGGAAGSNTGTASPISVGSLTNGKTYTCTVTATNAVGTSPASDASAAVIPAAAPDAPAQPSVARGNHQIAVSFSPPADNGSAITSYTASCTSLDGGAPGSDSDTGSPITVTGLTNGKTYTCTVTATNGVGTSSASLPSLPVIPAAVPDPPTITSVTRGNAAITVAFTPGADNGSAIISYTASCTSSNGGASGSNTGTGSPITVSLLTNGKTYTCTVTATNAVGTSPPSDASAAVIPATVPAAPTITSVTGGDASIAVAFTPGTDNGSAITSYTATCTSLNGGAPGSDSDTGSPVTVTGLTNGKTYTCTVTATNGVGTSSASLPSLPVIPAAVPDPPTITSVTRGNASITVAFAPGADNGSTIISYTASCTSSNGGTSGTSTYTGSPITVSGLTNGKTYTCTVTATNAIGTSAPSAPSAAVVPATVPDAPAQPSVAPGNHEILVTFTPPDDNGSAITSYTASCTSLNGGAPGTNTDTASPITVSGLTNGKTYTCTVTATNAFGPSSASLPSLPVIPAAVPDPPTITGVTRGNASISVAFTAGANNGYTILFFTASCTSSNGGVTGSNVGTTSPITVSGLTNGKTYTCVVSATNAVGTGPPSDPSAGVIPAAAPAAPAQPTATAGSHLIVVSFSPPADNGSAITSYTASCTSLTGAPGSDSDTSSPITVTGLTNGAAYTCTVTATNAVGTSSASLPSLPAIPAAVPDPPTITSVTRGNASISVAFTAGANNGFPILFFTASCTSSNSGTPGSNVGATSPITVSGLTNGKTYTCTVTATNAIGTSPPSDPSAAVIPAAAPAAPTITSATGGNASISVAFTPGADNGSAITSYSASCTSLTGAPGTNTGTASPITVTGLTNGAVYTCTVTATNGVGTSSPSLPSLPAIPAAVPDPPTITSVTRGNASISVAFTAGADNGFTILYFTASCTSSNGGVTGSNTGLSSPITVSGLTNGKTYRCTVTATNAIGTSLPSAPSAPVIPAGPPNAPAQPTVAAGNHQIVVSFTPPANNGSTITSYTASCTSLLLGTPGTNTGTASPITVTGLTNGAVYTCTVTATNAIGTSAPSPPSLPVIPAAVPDAPAQPTVIGGNQQIEVSFTAPADNGSTILSYTASCTSSNGGTPGTNFGTASPITVIGLTNGKTYRCTVTATNAFGTSPPSPPSAPVIPSGAPYPPIIGTVTSGNGSGTVSFTASADNGSPILYFTATCTSSNGGALGSRTGSASPITVTGLTNGKTYTCRVTATNAAGTSAPSRPSLPFVPGHPEAPINARAEPLFTSGPTGSLQVSFTPGPDNGGPITSYKVSCAPADGGVPGSQTGTASPITVAALTTGKIYFCTVTATNARGESIASNPARGVVGAPGTVVVLRVLPLAHGLALPFNRPPDNGSAIIGYRADCTSSNGGVFGSPFQPDSPIVAPNLTDGKTYTCIVTAKNGRGVGPETLTAPVVVGRPNVTYLASCSGTTGSVAVAPGLLLGSPHDPQTWTLASTMGSCTGPYVTSARIAISFRSATAIGCGNTVNTINSGSGWVFWPSPNGMGKSAVTLRFVVTSTSGHVTQVKVYGDVRSQANVFTLAHISGNLTMNRGLKSTANGGDCTTTTPLKNFGVTAITMKVT